ncbi:MAG: coiled-coil domain-containing protein [Phycisphaerales bacterium]
MSSLLTNTGAALRGASALPDFGNAGSLLGTDPFGTTQQPSPADRPERTIGFPDAVPQSADAALQTAKLDAAVAINRANTPAGAAEQRRAPRYSVRESNRLTDEQIVQRLQSLDLNEDRPGIVKVLDILDLPRNFIQNTLTEHFVPEAKRMAEERRDYDQFGNLKVYGSDILRAMGFENRAVNAVAGFFVDIVTDPLSFIGAPIGGLTQTGAKGAVQLSNRGSKLIRSSINSVRQGGTVADPLARRVIEETLNAGLVTGTLKEGADAATRSKFLRDSLLGSSSKVSKAAGRVGLGRVTSGGLLVEDTFRAVAKDKVDDVSRAVAGRVEAVKAFTRKHANNNGIDLTRGRGGAEIAHIPFTSRTLTVPAFGVPGLRTRFGQRAEMQVAVAQALRGNLPEASVTLRASSAATQLTRAQKDLDELHELRRQAVRKGADPEEVLEVESRIDQVLERVAEQRERVAQIEKMAPEAIARSFAQPESLGDLLVMGDAYEDAAQSVRLAEMNARWIKDVDGRLLARATRDDIRGARADRAQLVDELVRRGLANLETVMDDLADPARQTEAFREVVQAKRERAAARVRDLLTAGEADLRELERVADTFQGVVEASQRVADLRLGHVRSVLSSDQRLLAEGARMMLGISDQQIGHIPFQSIDAFLRSSGRLGMASRVNQYGRNAAVHFGTNKGVLNDVMRNLSHDVTMGANERAAATLQGVVDRMEAAINRAPNVRGSDFDDVSELAFLAVEQELIRRARGAGFPEFADRATKGTRKARELLERSQRSGLLADDAMRDEVTRIAEEVADYFEEVGQQAVLAGDITSPLAVYAPVLLKQEAAKRAELLRRSDGAGSQQAAELLDAAGGPGAFDPSKRRVTNMIEFKDLHGREHAFTIAEGAAYARYTDGDLASLRERGLASQADNAERVRRGVSQFKHSFGLSENLQGDQLIEAMQSRSRPMLPSELNAYAESGALTPIVGGVISGFKSREFFETSLTNILYTRARAHEVARAKDAFRDVIEPFIVIDSLPRLDTSTQLGSRTGRLATGEEFQFVGDGERIKIGRTMYRRIGDLDKRFPHDSALSIDSLLRGKHSTGYIPEQLAVQLERVADKMRPEPMGEVMRLAERFTSLFRSTTLIHPSWAVTNTVGNTFLAAMMGMLDPKRAPRFSQNLVRAARIHFQENMDTLSQRSILGRAGRRVGTKLGYRDGETMIFGGAPMRTDQILEELSQNGVKQTISGDQYDLLFNQVSRAFPNLDTQPRTSAGRSFQSSLAQSRARQAGNSRLMRAGNTVAAAAQSIPAQRAKSGIKAWFQLNATLDQIFRTAAYMTLRNEGLDSVSAANQVRRGMLNFGDLSSFESNTIRPLIPFYSWVKASLPNILARSIRDPKLLSAVPKITEGLEALTAGEDRVPQHMRPRWIQETMGIQLGTDPNTRSAFLAGTLLPQEGALQVLAGAGGVASLFGDDPLDFDDADFMDSVNWFTTQFSPTVRVPVELGVGREAFSGRDIGTEPGEGEITLGEYLTNQFRPIKEFGFGIGSGSVPRAFERSALEGTTRLAVGGRVQPSLQEERIAVSHYFDLKDDEANLRKAIRLADKEGDEQRSVKLRLRLLERYLRFVRLGGDPQDIPKWAREDLAAHGFLGE